jgi:hypothetical protein
MHVAQSYQVITQLQLDALMNMVLCWFLHNIFML